MQGTNRYQLQKKKRINRLLNIAIGIVALLILFFGAQLFLSNPTSEETINDITENEEEENEEAGQGRDEEQHDQQEAREPDPSESVPNEEEEQEEPLEEDELPEVNDGEWEPIGTSQQESAEEPFVADYDENGQNWAEMERALQYATGLGEDMVIWRLGNGGSPQTAVGTVSTYENRQTPYQVRLEWVMNEGWKPTSVEVLDSNPYQ
ncbi:YrrS family protein [Desertibacillus haloalkaliphilus]|uniref:YrrS family protein n=1 Tax=Desertibacillus haloalkaliphilus TaxID=1328930 RepID=UPI001C267B03|nr:YrrS family protein [Desertibacillus haloalkaliphilus]MBU8905546.1 YrrS family protein [Desertibacillus haloalkaliphilus]